MEVLAAVLVLCVLPGVLLQNTADDFAFYPVLLSMRERTEANITLLYKGTNSTTDLIQLKVSSASREIANVNYERFNLTAVFNNTLLIAVEAGHLGITTLGFMINSGSSVTSLDYTVEVYRARPPVDEALNYLLIPFLIVNAFAMGTTVEWNLVVKILKRPSGVAVGILSQFVLMPLFAFGLAKAFSLAEVYAIGLLMVGSAPGGGLSNILTYFVEADLPLSMTMTFVSTLLALGMMPLSLFIYGRAFQFDSINVPFENIVISLVSITVPELLGILLRHKKPHIADKVMKIIRPVSALFIIAVVVLGVIVNSHVVYTPWQAILAALLLPIAGFLFGFGLAKIFCLDNHRAKTVSIETAVQNGLLASAMIRLSFPQPESDLSFTVSFVNGMAQIGVAILVIATYSIYKCTRPASEEEKMFNLGEQSSVVQGEANPTVMSNNKE